MMRRSKGVMGLLIGVILLLVAGCGPLGSPGLPEELDLAQLTQVAQISAYLRPEAVSEFVASPSAVVNASPTLTPSLEPSPSPTVTEEPTNTAVPYPSTTPASDPNATVFLTVGGPPSGVISECVFTYVVDVADPDGIADVWVEQAQNAAFTSAYRDVKLTRYGSTTMYSEPIVKNTTANPGTDTVYWRFKALDNKGNVTYHPVGTPFSFRDPLNCGGTIQFSNVVGPTSGQITQCNNFYSVKAADNSESLFGVKVEYSFEPSFNNYTSVWLSRSGQVYSGNLTIDTYNYPGAKTVYWRFWARSLSHDVYDMRYHPNSGYFSYVDDLDCGGPTRTPTATPVPTGTPAPSATQTQQVTSTPTKTATSASPTSTGAPSATPTSPPAASPTSTATTPPTATPAPTSTPTATSPPSATPVSCSFSSNSSFESQLINLINAERASRGMGALTANSALTAAARGHSQDMGCNDFFSHTGSDGSDPFQRMTAQGYSFSAAAENLYAGGDAQGAFDAWMASSGHRDNMLNPVYVHIGVGYSYVSGSTYGSYFTANFGTP